MITGFINQRTAMREFFIIVSVITAFPLIANASNIQNSKIDRRLVEKMNSLGSDENIRVVVEYATFSGTLPSLQSSQSREQRKAALNSARVSVL